MLKFICCWLTVLRPASTPTSLALLDLFPTPASFSSSFHYRNTTNTDALYISHDDIQVSCSVSPHLWRIMTSYCVSLFEGSTIKSS